ncbi:thioredoxin family protein [Maribacter cobaltidurans]|uniref:Thioredoxin family protein n=1 Tax=Maribacter cobaltidurans TaxID=1178778 RepID=A0A223V5C4_9FLAO|nr:thioredoxin family protein [Maribacter cobaltidurans]ASV30502.1 thioredoxin family protein [Maribacter cobaltidurans]GGD79281.1 thioredoxin [Maribacter cobaltidurans]
MDVTTKISLTQALSNAISYHQYLNLVKIMAIEGKSTGNDTSEAYVNYTKLNAKRMQRWDKTLRFDDEVINKIKSVYVKVNWLVLTESWCGDASPALPVMNKISELNPNITLKVVIRDEHPELMRHFLTNGAMSIPKLIQLEPETQRVLGTWGPRSTKATHLVDAFKKEHGALTAEFRESLQIWYNKDKGQSILQDLLNLLSLE